MVGKLPFFFKKKLQKLIFIVNMNFLSQNEGKWLGCNILIFYDETNG